MEWKSSMIRNGKAKKERMKESQKKNINEIVAEWSSNWRFSYECRCRLCYGRRRCRSSSSFPSSVFTFQHGQFMKHFYRNCEQNSTPTVDFYTEQLFNTYIGIGMVALLWFVCNVFFIIAISFIWCCLDSSSNHTLTSRWKGKREITEITYTRCGCRLLKPR